VREREREKERKRAAHVKVKTTASGQKPLCDLFFLHNGKKTRLGKTLCNNQEDGVDSTL